MRHFYTEDPVEENVLLNFTKDILFPVAIGNKDLSPREKWLLGIRIDDAAVLLDDYLLQKIIEISLSPSSGVYFPFPNKLEYSVDDLCWIRRWAVQHRTENVFFEDYFFEYCELIQGNVIPARERHLIDRCGEASVHAPWMHFTQNEEGYFAC